MYITLIVFHVIACLVLIFVVLLQAGRGGGMSDMMGGGQPQSLFGTQTNAFLMRATEVCAVLFVITSLSLGILSTQRGKSLVARDRTAEALKTLVPAIPASETKLEPVEASAPEGSKSLKEDLSEAALPEGLLDLKTAEPAKADAS